MDSRCCQAGGLEEQEIREFDKQAMGPDSLILNHLGKLKSFTTGQKRGILTRDYICLYGGNMPCVLKLSRLTQAYIKDNTYYVKVGKTRKQAHYLTIHLMTEDKKTAWPRHHGRLPGASGGIGEPVSRN